MQVSVVDWLVMMNTFFLIPDLIFFIFFFLNFLLDLELGRSFLCFLVLELELA